MPLLPENDSEFILKNVYRKNKN